MTEAEFFALVESGPLGHLNILVRLQRTYRCLQYLVEQSAENEKLFRQWLIDLGEYYEKLDSINRSFQETAAKPSKGDKDDDWTN